MQKSLYGERACEVVYSVGERLTGFHEQLVAPVSHSPKKLRTLEGAIAEEITQINEKDKKGKPNNTIEEQMIESTIIVD